MKIDHNTTGEEAAALAQAIAAAAAVINRNAHQSAAMIAHAANAQDIADQSARFKRSEQAYFKTLSITTIAREMENHAVNAGRRAIDRPSTSRINAQVCITRLDDLIAHAAAITALLEEVIHEQRAEIESTLAQLATAAGDKTSDPLPVVGALPASVYRVEMAYSALATDDSIKVSGAIFALPFIGDIVRVEVSGETFYNAAAIIEAGSPSLEEMDTQIKDAIAAARFDMVAR